MTDMPEFIAGERAKVIFRICQEDGAVITMETCLKLARLWSQSDVYKRGIMIDILRQYDDKQNS
jgi:hypothetical protein